MSEKFTSEELASIQSLYRGAKNQKKQISILADLYACKEKDIIDALNVGRGEKHAKERKAPHAPYSQKTKSAAMNAVLHGRMTYTAASKEYGVPIGTLSYWISTSRANGTNGKG